MSMTCYVSHYSVGTWQVQLIFNTIDIQPGKHMIGVGVHVIVSPVTSFVNEDIAWNVAQWSTGPTQKAQLSDLHLRNMKWYGMDIAGYLNCYNFQPWSDMQGDYIWDVIYNA